MTDTSKEKLQELVQKYIERMKGNCEFCKHFDFKNGQYTEICYTCENDKEHWEPFE